ncbi:MAG: hypothetical protein U0R52_06490 [Solirubrobacterales bacterium]
MATGNVLDEARSLLEHRRDELVDELKRVEKAITNLGGRIGRRAPGRPRKAAPAATKRRRRRRGGTRAEQAVKIVSESPGITASEIAKQMKIKPNYLYRVLGDLQKEKRVRKDGRKYYAAS